MSVTQEGPSSEERAEKGMPENHAPRFAETLLLASVSNAWDLCCLSEAVILYLVTAIRVWFFTHSEAERLIDLSSQT
jgi:hypothetical protein